MPFDDQPTLSGRLVSIRPLRDDDYEALYAVASDPVIWEQHPVGNRHEQAVFQEFFGESLASGGALLVTDTATGQVIGSSRYFRYREDKDDIEIGWTFLARPYWGGQYNGELKQLMLEHAFRFVDSVVFFIDLANKRSQRAAEKIGAVRQPQPDSQGRFVYEVTAASYAETDTVIEYRPRLVQALTGSIILVLTGAILVWLGLILGPEDREAIDGIARLLFTVVPIRLFSWTMAAVFFVLAIWVARSLRGAPTLAISSSSLALRSGAVHPWSKLRSVEVSPDDILVIDIDSERDRALRGWRSWLGRLRRPKNNHQITLSSVELGSAPKAVAAELRNRMCSSAKTA